MSSERKENKRDSGRCPAHPDPGYPIFVPERVDECRSDCWTRTRFATEPGAPMLSRSSITATYDHRETGDRFTVESRLNGERVSITPIRDPFVSQRVVIGWRDLLRGLLRRRLEVETLVGGDRKIVEDVFELDNDYKGQHGSTRRAAWDAGMERALGDFAARAGEHDVS